MPEFRAGSAEQKQAILPALAEGKLMLDFAQGERHSRYALDRSSEVKNVRRANGSADVWTCNSVSKRHRLGSKLGQVPHRPSGRGIWTRCPCTRCAFLAGARGQHLQGADERAKF